MKRPIKFRGKEKYTLRRVYSDCLFQSNEGSGVIRYGLLEPNRNEWTIVYPNSVAQLVGYDDNGKEVYEGDIIVDVHGYELEASLRDNLDGGRVILKEGEK